MNVHDRRAGEDKKIARLFRNGRSQAVRIPKEWEFAGEAVEMRQLPDGNLLLVPAETAGLVEYLQTAEPWTGGAFVETDDDLLPLGEVRFE